MRIRTYTLALLLGLLGLALGPMAGRAMAAYNGTAAGTLTYETAPTGFSQDILWGTGGYITLAEPGALDLGSTWTVAFRFKTSSTGLISVWGAPPPPAPAS